jgi:hypothetical protein
MENNTDRSIFEFNLDEESKSNLSSIAQWTNINAITGLVAAGVTVISTVVTLNQLGNYSGSVAGPGIFGMLIGLTISLLMNIILLNASSNLKKGIGNTSQQHFATGLTKLATYFKVVGILTIIAISFVALALLVVLMTAGSRGI